MTWNDFFFYLITHGYSDEQAVRIYNHMIDEYNANNHSGDDLIPFEVVKEVIK